MPCSLLIAVGCLGLSAWIAWQHPLVVLTCAPRAAQPPSVGGDQRLIVDGVVKQQVWGLFTVGREDLPNVSQFTLRTKTSATGTPMEAVHAMTHDGSREVFTDTRPGLLHSVALLNSHLDSDSPTPLTLRRADWAWFNASWVLLLLGFLVLVRNVILRR